MRKYIYVDTENVNSSVWFPYLRYLNTTDLVVLPYTRSSNKIEMPVTSVEDCRIKCCFDCITIDKGGHNALDFVLVTELTKHCVLAKKSVHVVISRDQGFDAAITHLRTSTGNRNIYRFESLLVLFKNYRDLFNKSIPEL